MAKFKVDRNGCMQKYVKARYQLPTYYSERLFLGAFAKL